MTIKVNATTKIRVVYTDWYPYTFQQENQASGFEIKILKAVMDKIQVKIELAKYPWKRCLDQLKKGKADALVSMLYTPEREKYAIYPKEYISVSRTILATTSERQIKFDGSFEGLKEYVIGYILGFSYGEKFDNATYLKKDSSKNIDGLIRKLIRGRNDLIAENQAVINASALKLQVQHQIRFLEPPIHTQKLFVGFSRHNKLEHLSLRFSAALKEFKNTKLYAEILSQYNLQPSDMDENWIPFPQRFLK